LLSGARSDTPACSVRKTRAVRSANFAAPKRRTLAHSAFALVFLCFFPCFDLIFPRSFPTFSQHLTARAFHPQTVRRSGRQPRAELRPVGQLWGAAKTPAERHSGRLELSPGASASATTRLLDNLGAAGRWDAIGRGRRRPFRRAGAQAADCCRRPNCAPRRDSKINARCRRLLPAASRPCGPPPFPNHPEGRPDGCEELGAYKTLVLGRVGPRKVGRPLNRRAI